MPTRQLKNQIASLDKHQRTSAINSLSKDEVLALAYDWDFWVRPDQREPTEQWTNWMVMAGRGYGKTRVGAEQTRKWVQDYPIVNIIGATADDARDIMIEGESGILAVCPKSERPEYKPSKRKLVWPNGATSLIFTADQPERLRGKQHMKLWCDELAAWRYAEEAWDQAMFGLRLGDNPQAIITTTPKPIKLVKQLIKDPDTVVTYGTTYMNRANLAEGFYRFIISKYEGTRLGRQELNAELLEDIENALWTWKVLDDYRHLSDRHLPAFTRIGIGIDPAVSANPDSNETGIIAAGLGTADSHGYILGDASGIYTPLQWAKKAMGLYESLNADFIVAEKNNGGDLVESNLRAAGFKGKVILVHASRGKVTRAEPVSGLYDQGKVHHVGTFSDLESQMTTWDPTISVSPDRVDALVWILTKLMLKSVRGKAKSRQG